MKNSDLPEDDDRASLLYRAFTTTREPVEDRTGNDNERTPNAEIEADDTISCIYRSYQITRKADYSRPVEQIMNRVRDEATALPAQQQAIKRIVEQASTLPRPEINQTADPSVDQLRLPAGPSVFTQLLGAPAAILKKFIEALSGLSPVAGAGLGAIAAAAVTFMLFPLFIAGTGDNGANVNDDLLALAPQVTQYIDQSEPLSIGFSDSLPASNRAFQFGVIATDLSIAVRADNVERLRHIASRIVELDDQNGKLTTVAIDLYKTTEASQYQEDVVASKVDSLQQALTDTQLERQWFDLGAQVESVYLSVEYALQSDQRQPLVAAITSIKGTALPQTLSSPADDLVRQLRAVTLSDQASVEKLREIRRIASSLKSVMY